MFISRHSSASGKPTLSVHTPGNFGEARLGGLPKIISVSPATAMSDALKALLRYKVEFCLDYEVSYECTHHGPSLNVPVMFVGVRQLRSTMERFKSRPSRRPLNDVRNLQVLNTNQFSRPRNRRNTLQPKIYTDGFGWRSCFRTHDTQTCCSQHRFRNVVAMHSKNF